MITKSTVLTSSGIQRRRSAYSQSRREAITTGRPRTIRRCQRSPDRVDGRSNEANVQTYDLALISPLTVIGDDHARRPDQYR
jgi:hypothetical protein